MLNATDCAKISNRKKYTDMLMHISARMLNDVDEDHFFSSMLAAIGETMQVSRVYVFDYDGVHWSNSYEWVAPGIAPQKNQLQKITMSGMNTEHSMLYSLLRGEVYKVSNVNDIADKITRSVLLQQHIHAVLAVPLFYENGVRGFFGFDICNQSTEWPAESIDVIIAIGNLLSSAKSHFHMRKVLKLKEHQLHDILDAFIDPIYVADMENYHILFCNKCLVDKFAGRDLSKEKCHKIFQNLDEPCSFCSNELLRQNNEPYVWHHHNDVLKRDYKVIDRNILWDNHKFARLSIAMDITDSLQIQREEVLARESSLARGRFLANMSHELRTPLNGIIGLNHLALQADPSPKISDYLVKMQASSKNLLSIINEILDFSKIDAGKMELENVSFTFGDVLLSVQNTMQTEVDRKGLNLTVDIDPTIPSIVCGDALRFNQILLNLTSNAVKFTENGTIAITASAYCLGKRDVCVRLLVRDSGIGMSEDEIGRLFTEFTQADSSTTRRYGGTGLGLTIAKRLVEMMRGSILVRSQLGVGTTFECYVTFDVPETSNASDAQYTGKIGENALGEAPQPDIDLHGVSILLVEDNEINQIIASEVLQQKGCLVDVAGDGLIALEKLKGATYDVVLMDIQMPNMDGLEATRRIRLDSGLRDLPIVAMTAHAMISDYEESFATGMQDYVTKPFSPEALCKVVGRWARKKL